MNSGNKKEEGLLITLHYKIYSNMKMLLRNMGQNLEIYKVGSCTSLNTRVEKCRASTNRSKQENVPQTNYAKLST